MPMHKLVRECTHTRFVTHTTHTHKHTNKYTGAESAFGDWYVLTQVDDAVISDASSFGYTALAVTGLLPVTVWNDDAARPSTPTAPVPPAWRPTTAGRCERRVWGAHTHVHADMHGGSPVNARPFEMVNSAEAWFEPPPVAVDASPRDPRTCSWAWGPEGQDREVHPWQLLRCAASTDAGALLE